MNILVRSGLNKLFDYPIQSVRSYTWVYKQVGLLILMRYLGLQWHPFLSLSMYVVNTTVTNSTEFDENSYDMNVGYHLLLFIASSNSCDEK